MLCNRKLTITLLQTQQTNIRHRVPRIALSQQNKDILALRGKTQNKPYMVKYGASTHESATSFSGNNVFSAVQCCVVSCFDTGKAAIFFPDNQWS